MSQPFGKTRRFLVALFALALAFAVFHPHRAVAQCDDPDACSNNGNGQPGSAGGAGGGAGGGKRGGGGGTSGSQTGNQPGSAGSPGGAGTGGASAGNGANGAPGSNVIADQTPTPPPGSFSSRHPSASSTPGPSGSSGSNDSRLTTWSKDLATTTDEINTWFGTISENDSIGGQAQPIVVHPGDQVTVFDGAAAANDQGTTADGSSLQTGVQGIADSIVKPGQKVDVVMHSQPVPLTTTTTQDDGRFSATVRIPSSTGLGRHFIVALVPNTKQAKTAFVFPLSVTARPDAAAVVDSPPPQTPRHFPWVLLEAVLGTLGIAGLIVIRRRRAASGAPSGAVGPG